MKFKSWFSKRKAKDTSEIPKLEQENETAEEQDEWYEAEEDDGILQKIEKPRATTFKKKWIYGIGGLLTIIFSVSLVTGVFLGTNRKIEKTEEDAPQQQNIVKGSHLQNMQNDEANKDKLPKVKEKKEPQPIEPPQSPPPAVRSYSPVPQSRYVPQIPPQSVQAPQRQLTAEEKELLKRLEAKQKANESPIRFDLKVEEKT